MKGSLRLRFLMALVGIFTVAGMAWATVGLLDFQFNGTPKSEITHDIADCVPPSGSFLSCDIGYPSDSFEINAALKYVGNDFGTDVTENGIGVDLYETGNCTGTPISYETIPGGAVHQTTTGGPHPKTIYSFDGSLPNFAAEDFTQLSMEITETSSTATLHLEGNANLCNATSEGTVSLRFSIAAPDDSDSDTDTQCVQLTPEYNTLDVSNQFCVD